MSSAIAVARASSGVPPKIFSHSQGEFADSFNRLPFPVTHNLGEHPLFELERLVELAKTLWTLGGAKVVFQDAGATFGNRWDEIQTKTVSFISGIGEIQNSNSWVLLKSVQEVPEYRECIEQCIEELSELVGVELKDEITWLDGYIFIASPGAVTPHHIDHESNFLLQIKGSKNFNVCDPNDRSLLYEEEIESYYAGDLSAATFKANSQEKAFVFPIVPGSGVHIPSKGPHWVQNGDTYSVSFSLNFCMRETDARARIYQCNHFLRKLDLLPTPPGESAIKDWLKVMTLARWGSRKASNKNELLRMNLRRLEEISRIAEKTIRRRPAADRGTA